MCIFYNLMKDEFSLDCCSFLLSTGSCGLCGENLKCEAFRRNFSHCNARFNFCFFFKVLGKLQFCIYLLINT